jgi:hypothetical protein
MEEQMRPESLRLLREAARINPSAFVRDVANQGDQFAEALFDVHAAHHTHEQKAYSPGDWEALTEELDNDPRTLAQYIDQPSVRALIRAQEAAHAAA